MYGMSINVYISYSDCFCLYSDFNRIICLLKGKRINLVIGSLEVLPAASVALQR